MRWALLTAVVLACLLAVTAGDTSDVEAGGIIYINVSSADTIDCAPYGGFISIKANSGAVGVKILSDHFSAGEPDSGIIPSGEVLNVDLYKAGRVARGVAIYPAGGATATGFIW